jgi:hypothetical protein
MLDVGFWIGGKLRKKLLIASKNGVSQNALTNRLKSVKTNGFRGVLGPNVGIV